MGGSEGGGVALAEVGRAERPAIDCEAFDPPGAPGEILTPYPTVIFFSSMSVCRSGEVMR